MSEITIYTSLSCPYCVTAKQLLDKKNVSYHEVRIDLDPGRAEEMIARSNRRTVPQIFIGDYHVGGCDDLYALDRAGKLDPLLQSTP